MKEVGNGIFFCLKLSILFTQGAFFCSKTKGELRMERNRDYSNLQRMRDEIEELEKKETQKRRVVNRKKNKVDHLEKKYRNERTHELCVKAAHLEYVFPKIKEMDKAQYVLFVEGLKDVPGVREYVEAYEIKEIEEVNE